MIKRGIWLAMAALPLLSGCVAAAIPVLAAGGLVKARSDGPGERVASGLPRVAIPADPPTPIANGAAAGSVAEAPPPAAIVRDYAFADGSTVTVTNSMGTAPRPVPAPIAPATPLPLPAQSPRTEADVPTATLLAGVTELPAPTAAAPGSRPAGLGPDYSRFTAFARAQAAIPAAGADRRSAMLTDSGQLVPETRACSIHPAAVLIDLDPAGDTLDTARPLAADPVLAASLAELRREGVEIGWISSRTADRAGAIRKALAGAGLDPEGRDQLVLLRFPEERKQTRREDFAKAHCVLAIAGDERADFDELFSYLRDPNAATPLDTLIDKGWFLVPPPLS